MNLRMLPAVIAAWALTGCAQNDDAASTSVNPRLAQASQAIGPGKTLYERTCAGCHASPTDARTPTFATLAAMPADIIRDAMREGGKMAPMASALSEAEREQLIAFLTAGQSPSIADWPS